METRIRRLDRSAVSGRLRCSATTGGGKGSLAIPLVSLSTRLATPGEQLLRTQAITARDLANWRAVALPDDRRLLRGRPGAPRPAPVRISSRRAGPPVLDISLRSEIDRCRSLHTPPLSPRRQRGRRWSRHNAYARDARRDASQQSPHEPSRCVGCFGGQVRFLLMPLLPVRRTPPLQASPGTARTQPQSRPLLIRVRYPACARNSNRRSRREPSHR